MFAPELIRSEASLYFVCPLDEAHLRTLPWDDQPFDVFIVVLEDRKLAPAERRALEQVVRSNSDWVETCGHDAELLHDEIDEISVSIGRQEAIGDGSPMTAWHEDLVAVDGIVDYLALRGLGSNDSKLVCVVARGDRVEPLLEHLRDGLRALDRGARSA